MTSTFQDLQEQNLQSYIEENKERESGDARYYATTLRLKPHIGELLERVSEHLGMSKTAVLIAALHDYARAVGVSSSHVTLVSDKIDRYRPI